MAEAFTVIYNLLPETSVALHDTIAEAIAKTAEEIRMEAAYHAPVDTGFMQSSLYVSTKEKSTYGQDIVPGRPGSYMLEEVAKPSDDLTAYVAAGANYSIFVEMGTSRQCAQPYLVPAAILGQDFLNGWLSDLEEKMLEKVAIP